MVANREPVRVTVEEWRAQERVSAVKHEYVDGHIYAMAGGSRAHMLLVANAVGALNGAFGDGPCVAYPLDLATRVAETRFLYPDVVVTCAECDQPNPEETEVTEPRVIIEVLSPSTERRDRGRKWDYYRQCNSLQEYVLVGTEYQRVEVYRRTAEGWALYQLFGPNDTVSFISVGVRIVMSELYRRTGIPEVPPDEDATPDHGDTGA
jgi:Uma2 family endonuclease